MPRSPWMSCRICELFNGSFPYLECKTDCFKALEARGV